MAEIAGATITYTDYTGAPADPRLLNVPDAVGDVTVQDIVDTLSAKQAELDALVYDALLDIPDTSGKQVLSATKLVGITCVSIRTQVKFQDLPGPSYTIKRVTDGNFVSIDDEVARNQIEEMASSTFVNWKTEADVSAALLNVTEVETLETSVVALQSQVAAMQLDTTLVRQMETNRLEVNIATQKLVLYADDGLTILQQWHLATRGGEPVATTSGVQVKRGAPQL